MSEPTRNPAIRDKGISVVRLLVDENPKLVGSQTYERFFRYHDGMTVKAALEVGITRRDIRWDTEHGFVAVFPPDNPNATLERDKLLANIAKLKAAK